MISGIYTIMAMGAFFAVAWWAYTRNNRARFDEAARLPLSDEEVPLGIESAGCDHGGDRARSPS